jgi:hypothetical protein
MRWLAAVTAAAFAALTSSSRTESLILANSGELASIFVPRSSKSRGPPGKRPVAPAAASISAIFIRCVRPSMYPAPTANAT